MYILVAHSSEYVGVTQSVCLNNHVFRLRSLRNYGFINEPMSVYISMSVSVITQ